MMSLFYYFRSGYGSHSNTNAYLLSLLSYYIYDKKDVAGVYVFGAPRVGTFQGWRDQYKIAGLWDLTFRWVNYRDPAHKVPDYGDARPWRQNVTNRYAHVGRLNLFSKSGSATYNHSNPDYEPGATVAPTDGSYHAMNQYCIRLFNRLSGRSRRSQNNPGYLTKHDVKVPLPV